MNIKTYTHLNMSLYVIFNVLDNESMNFICYQLSYRINMGQISKPNKAVLEPRVSPDFAITYFAIIVILDLKIQIKVCGYTTDPFFPKT